jgi:hypothetical protein
MKEEVKSALCAASNVANCDANFTASNGRRKIYADYIVWETKYQLPRLRINAE